MSSKLRTSVQLLFLAFFIVIAVLGKMQVWMVIFITGVVGAAVLGRFYCGWVCPTNTAMEGQSFLLKKLGIKRKQVPAWVKMPFVKYSIMVLFIAVMIFTMVSGRKFPVLIILSSIGITLSFFFVPSVWHRYACPFGTILALPGRIAGFGYGVDRENCSKCGLCKAVCPGEAIDMKDRSVFPYIRKSLCLECAECVEACSKNAVKYLQR